MTSSISYLTLVKWNFGPLNNISAKYQMTNRIQLCNKCFVPITKPENMKDVTKILLSLSIFQQFDHSFFNPCRLINYVSSDSGIHCIGHTPAWGMSCVSTTMLAKIRRAIDGLTWIPPKRFAVTRYLIKRYCIYIMPMSGITSICPFLDICCPYAYNVSP
jgi:hypothetical protein